MRISAFAARVFESGGGLHPSPLPDTIELMSTTRWMGVVCGLVLSVFDAHAQALVDRGKSLVEKVGHCGDCHTPGAENGKPDPTRLLKGVKSARLSTPDLTSSGDIWANWKEDGLRNFLERGMAPSGNRARHPMPAYKLRPDDAESIVQYLKTLK